MKLINFILLRLEVTRGCKGFDWVGFTVMQDDGQRGIVKTLECLIANDNVAFDYAVAA